MNRASQKFDRQLFTLKLSELSHQMQIKSVASDKAAQTDQDNPYFPDIWSRSSGGPNLIRMVDGQLALLGEWLKGVDRIAREVWQTQGEAITPDFVRDVLVPEAMTLIGAREGTIKSSVAADAQRTHLEDPYAAQHHLAMEVNHLKGKLTNRYEIEARELEYRKAPAAQESGSQNQLDEIGSIRGLIEDATKDTALWLQADPSAEERAHVLAMQERLTDLDRIIAHRVESRSLPNGARQWSETVGKVLSRLDKAREVRGNIVGKSLSRLAESLPQELPGSKPPKRPRVKLPAPVRTVNTSGSIGLGSHELKLTQRPLNPPTYFPEDLWASTCVILDEAIEKFPNREQLPELCRRYISKMTPVYCEAVKSGKMKAGWVLQERLGGMLDLLHSLLAHNDDGPSSGGLSNKTYGTYEEARNSKEFRKLEKAIADVQTEMQHNSTGADRLRTGEQQAESSRAQNSATSAQGVASKSTNHRALVDAYIQEARTKKGKRVTMKEIWSAAGYNSRTEFERWVRQDPKHPNKAADETFTRLLCVEKPHLK